MTRRGGWLRLLLLASLLAWPRLAFEPAGQAPASLRADDGQVALAARPPVAVRLLSNAPSGGAAPHRGVLHPLPALPSPQLRAATLAAASTVVPPAATAPRGRGSPRFPTGPPVTLPST